MAEVDWRRKRVKRLQQLVSDSQAGDPAAKRQLNAFLYRELEQVATSYLRRTQRNADMAGLVHKTLTQIVTESLHFDDRGYFYTTAAKLMRGILVDRAKEHIAKRDGNSLPLTDPPSNEGALSVIEIDRALSRLSEQSAAAACVVELHYFAGLSASETARVLNQPIARVARDIRMSKAWLLRELKNASDAKQ